MKFGQQLLKNHDPANEQLNVLYCVDRFSVFKRSISINGWAYSLDFSIVQMSLKFPSGRMYPLELPNLPSADVAAIHGPAANLCRFNSQILVNEPHDDILNAELAVNLSNGRSIIVNAVSPPQHTHWVLDDFLTRLSHKPLGKILEVGSRARSGVVRSNLTPANWSYTGLDVMAGNNVDVVGDAHELSKIFAADKKFDAVMAFSVLEHLLMPWKFVIELNKILNIGAIGIFTTHQAWPVHDAPWDFWRFSDKAWHALFNKMTGFEIITTALGEPAYTVAYNCHAVTNFGDQPSYLSSAVLFKKISDTQLDWPVQLGEILQSTYPLGQLPLITSP